MKEQNSYTNLNDQDDDDDDDDDNRLLIDVRE